MTTGCRIFGAPQRYIQGPDALDMLGAVAAAFGTTPVVVADAFILETMGARLEEILAGAGTQPSVCSFQGEITYAAIDGLDARLGGVTPSIVIGVGGGKSLDAAKALARKRDCRVITVPTIASNDSPTSAAIAMYDDQHVMIAVDRLAHSPEAVIVDTKLIASAPASFLRAGIGDALSKKFEAEGCLAGRGVTPFGTRPLMTGIVIADACYRTLRQHAAAAIASVERGEVSDALEATVEAVILMSGLGFENGGLSLAHSLTRGLVQARGAKDAIHGQQIAWGVLVQLTAEGRPDSELADIIAFHHSLGLATTLQALGMSDVTQEEISDIAKWTMTAPHLSNLPAILTAADVIAAVNRVERMAIS